MDPTRVPVAQASSANTHQWKDLGCAISLANLCYVHLWAGLLYLTPKDLFLARSVPSSNYLAAVAGNTILTGCLFWAVIRLARRTQGRVAGGMRIAFLLFLTIPANSIRATFAVSIPQLGLNRWLQICGQIGLAALVLGAVAVTAVCIIRWNRRLTSVAKSLLMVALPLAPMNFLVTSVAVILHNRLEFRARLSDTPGSAKPTPAISTGGHRAIWFIFDELDQRLAFSERPGGLSLPELDRLRSEVIYATSAFPPADETFRSLPALLTGRMVTDAEAVGSKELVLRFNGKSEYVDLSGEATIFSEARAAGLSCAVAGWYLPYCRIFGQMLERCCWEEMVQRSNIMGDSTGQIALNQMRSLFEFRVASPFGKSLFVQKHESSFQRILRATREFAVDRKLNLIFVHFPIPHEPYLSGHIPIGRPRFYSSVGKYFDSLELVDRTLGVLRRDLEASGLWKETAILVSSDHSHRGAHVIDGKTDARVPFLLKLPGVSQPVTFSEHFNTVRSKNLLLEILIGRVSTLDEALAWLRQPAN